MVPSLSRIDSGPSSCVPVSRNVTAVNDSTSASLTHPGPGAMAADRPSLSRADVENPDDIVRLFDATADAYGRLDYFVNNAAAAAFNILAVFVGASDLFSELFLGHS